MNTPKLSFIATSEFLTFPKRWFDCRLVRLSRLVKSMLMFIFLVLDIRLHRDNGFLHYVIILELINIVVIAIRLNKIHHGSVSSCVSIVIMFTIFHVDSSRFTYENRYVGLSFVFVSSVSVLNCFGNVLIMRSLDTISNILFTIFNICIFAYPAYGIYLILNCKLSKDSCSISNENQIGLLVMSNGLLFAYVIEYLADLKFGKFIDFRLNRVRVKFKGEVHTLDVDNTKKRYKLLIPNSEPLTVLLNEFEVM